MCVSFSWGKTSRTCEKLPTFFSLPSELCAPLLCTPSKMTSLFERVSKNLVKELGDKDLKPVKSPLDTNKFRQFALLRKKRKTRTEFWEKPDVSAECSLMDILEPSSLVPGIVNQW